MQILSFAKTAQTTSTGVDYAARRLRFVLMIGFGGMAVVFLLAFGASVAVLWRSAEVARASAEIAKKEVEIARDAPCG